jgi:hypothetical protein
MNWCRLSGSTKRSSRKHRHGRSLPSRGRIRSENRFPRALDGEVEQKYRQTILNALRESSNRMVACAEPRLRRLELEQQVTSASEGLTRSRQEEAFSLAKVYAALGGGWQRPLREKPTVTCLRKSRSLCCKLPCRPASTPLPLPEVC